MATEARTHLYAHRADEISFFPPIGASAQQRLLEAHRFRLVEFSRAHDNVMLLLRAWSACKNQRTFDELRAAQKLLELRKAESLEAEKTLLQHMESRAKSGRCRIKKLKRPNETQQADEEFEL